MNRAPESILRRFDLWPWPLMSSPLDRRAVKRTGTMLPLASPLGSLRSSDLLSFALVNGSPYTPG